MFLFAAKSFWLLISKILQRWFFFSVWFLTDWKESCPWLDCGSICFTRHSYIACFVVVLASHFQRGKFFLTLIVLPFSCLHLNDRRLESAFPKLKMYNTTQPHFSSRCSQTYQPADQPTPLLAPARPPRPGVAPPPRPAPPAPTKERTVSRFLCFGQLKYAKYIYIFFAFNNIWKWINF